MTSSRGTAVYKAANAENKRRWLRMFGRSATDENDCECC